MGGVHINFRVQGRAPKQERRKRKTRAPKLEEKKNPVLPFSGISPCVRTDWAVMRLSLRSASHRIQWDSKPTTFRLWGKCAAIWATMLQFPVHFLERNFFQLKLNLLWSLVFFVSSVSTLICKEELNLVLTVLRMLVIVRWDVLLFNTNLGWHEMYVK